MDRLKGGEIEKRRLKIVFETLSGERSIEQACEELGVSASRFHEIRKEALQAALEGLMPGAPGRPRRPEPPADPARLKQLEERNDELEAELRAAYVRTEIALAMPHVLTKESRADIKKKAREARTHERGGSGGGGHGP